MSVPVGLLVAEARRIRERRPDLSMDAAMDLAEERLLEYGADEEAEAEDGGQD